VMFRWDGVRWNACNGGTSAGTVTTATVISNAGVSATVSNPTTTPAFTFSLGAITPSTVNGNVINTGTGTVTIVGTSTLSGVNTGNQTITLIGAVTGAGTNTITTTMPNSGVSAGTYSLATITVGAGGIVTAASSGSVAAGGLSAPYYTDSISTSGDFRVFTNHGTGYYRHDFGSADWIASDGTNVNDLFMEPQDFSWDLGNSSNSHSLSIGGNSDSLKISTIGNKVVVGRTTVDVISENSFNFGNRSTYNTALMYGDASALNFKYIGYNGSPDDGSFVSLGNSGIYLRTAVTNTSTNRYFTIGVVTPIVNNNIDIDTSRIAFSADSITVSTIPPDRDSTHEIAPTAFVTKAIADVIPYKTYYAQVAQTGTLTPTINVLQNNLGFTPTWSRTTTGWYEITHTGGFIDVKTGVLITPNINGDPLIYTYDNEGSAPDAIIVRAFTNAAAPSDNAKFTIEIRIYN